MTPSKTSVEQFFENVSVEDNGCWRWTGTIRKDGYGAYSRDGARNAYRWSYAHHKGPIPVGLCLDHLCENKWCVNPDHLEAVTSGENARRSRRITPGTRRLRNGFCLTFSPDQADMLSQHAADLGVTKATVLDEALYEYFEQRHSVYPSGHSQRRRVGAKPVARISYQLDSKQWEVVNSYMEEFGVNSRSALIDEALGEFFAERGLNYPRSQRTKTGLIKRGVA